MPTYRDPKRYLWLASFAYPLVALAGPVAYLAAGVEAPWLRLPEAPPLSHRSHGGELSQ